MSLMFEALEKDKEYSHIVTLPLTDQTIISPGGISASIVVFLCRCTSKK